jgi:hypothetical protein
VSVLHEHGFKVSEADASLFRLERGSRRAFQLVYMDDGLIVGSKQDTQERINILEVFDISNMVCVSLS